MFSVLAQLGISPQEAFPLGSEVGFSVKTAANKGTDVAFEALMQATNAANATIAHGEMGNWFTEWALPVVVVRGALFTLGYSDIGGEVLREAAWSRLVWHGAAAFDKPTVVDVVTRAHWVRYVDELKATVSGIVERIDVHRAAAIAAAEEKRAQAAIRNNARRQEIQARRTAKDG
jgi:hypothetical protein